MTSTDLVVQEVTPQPVRLDTDQLTYIATTDFVPKNIRGNVPAILACVATGRELGIGDMAALRHVHIIEGTPSYSAQLMVALVRRERHSITGTTSNQQAVVRGKRRDTGDEMEVTWTLEDAKTAGLLSKRNWQQYPKSMLWNRAVAELCRELFPDVALGNGFYTPEELGEEHTDEGGALPVEPPPPDDPAEDVPFGDVAPATAAEVIAEKTDPLAKRKRKLDVIVKGTLRPPLRKVWTTVARMRGVTTDALIADLGGIEEDGELHWTPLRDAMTATELDSLIDKLEKLSPFQPPPDVQTQLEAETA